MTVRVVGVQEKRVGRVVDERSEAGLACSQPLFGLLALGQVDHEGHSLVPAPFEACLADHHGYAATILSLVLLFERLDAAAHLQLGLGLGVTLAPFAAASVPRRAGDLRQRSSRL